MLIQFPSKNISNILYIYAITFELAGTATRARICKRLWSPRIDSARLGIDSWAQQTLHENHKHN